MGGGRRLRDRRLITPHGDWKPVRVATSMHRRQGSLPLMGIGNGSCARASCGTYCRSLPLMGIGNLLRRTHCQLSTYILITPHGDWKRFSRNCWLRCVTWRSLPLMGIGNTTLTPDAARISTSSLPLMGIGNRADELVESGVPLLLITPHGDWKRRACGRYLAVRDSHYPSWGLETRRWAAAFRDGLVTLITPHGDWKRAMLPVNVDRRHNLITPHGDWKRGGTCKSATGPSSSLPLMGIGNPCRLANRSSGDRPDLITPHGDWKLLPVQREFALNAIPHYPSWGLETRSEIAGRDHHTARLITPHGDWKRGGAVGYRGLDRAHYPSWGLETSRRGLPRCPPRPSHYPSWGLETVGTPGDGEAGDTLITPHGDWKPQVDTAALPAVADSLPLMGIGNSGPAPRRRSQTRPSLPLMGIGNWWPGRSMRPPGHPALITPHGDWKPAAPVASVRAQVSSLPLMGIGNAGHPDINGNIDVDSLPLMGIGN